MIFSSVFAGGRITFHIFFICKTCFANTFAGLAKVLSLIVVPFVDPSFIQVFSSTVGRATVFQLENVQVPDLRNF